MKVIYSLCKSMFYCQESDFGYKGTILALRFQDVDEKIGSVVSTSDFRSGVSGFESRAGHLLDLFSVVLNPTGRLLSFGVLNPVLLHLNYKFVSSS